MKDSGKVIILLSVFNFLIWVSLGILTPIEVLFLKGLTASTSAIGIILSIPSLVLLVFSPYAIRLSDRYGSKRTMLAFVLLSVPFFALLPYSKSHQIYGLLRVASSLMYLITPVFFSYMSKTLKRLGVGYGSVILASSIGGSVGALIGGTVGQTLGFGAPYLIVAVSVMASSLFIFPLKEMRVHRMPAKPPTTRTGSLDALVIAVLVNTLVFSFHMSARGVIWPLVLGGVTSIPAFFSGLTFSLMGLTAAMLSIPSGILSERMGGKKVFFIGWGIMALSGVTLFFATRSLYLFLAFSLAYAVGEVLRGSSSPMILSRYKKSAYFGYSSSFNSLGGILGAVISGLMIDYVGTDMAVLMLGLVVLVPAVGFRLIVGRQKAFD